ncbi:phage/plasmid primase, P4 family [Butyrivibrio sp. M55]|uniref:phage/plasmid primase, P4 family n=1 Tax=Butyrivibrio sp. M55 TaxID=1855323 RepID=UPI0008F3CC2A|nr:phage/plasmid primase, P4 family [Butyrivibrio sp. M55]SFU88852.1 phage/plasmid primase, P4 family, C-terminal domain-containing protein [Butyrivibrio sp. M55]
MQITIFTAACTGKASNCSYPNRKVVTTPEEMKEAVRFDHVCAEYKGNYRSIGNFTRSDVVVMDIDNDHTEEPKEWITPEKLDEMLPDISYVIAFSRNHMKVKDGKAARPKFHVYFQIAETTDVGWYAAIKRGIKKCFEFFDGNALDAARFIFGADVEEPIWHEGWMTIDEEIEPVYEDESEEKEETAESGVIVQGSRNNTMSRFASRILKRYGDTEKAHVVFMEHAQKCDPPLPEAELKTIWNSAEKFFNKKISSSDGYVPPDQYNADFNDASLKPEDYSDIGEAKVLVQEYGSELRFSAATDYLRYDGERWVEDVQLAIGAIEEFLDLQLADAQQEKEVAEKALVDAGIPEAIVKSGSKAVAKEVAPDQMPLLYALISAETYLKFVLKRRDYKYIVSTGNASKPMIGIDVNDLDKNEFLINTPYATYDLRKGLTGEQPHNPEDLITKITTCAPGSGDGQLWLDALELFFCGDKELIKYVQLVVGMAAIGKVYQEHMIIAYGGGANGKSTFWNTIFRVLGDYAGKLSAEALTMNCKRNIKPEMAELKGRRLIISSEMEEGMRLNTATVKQLCSTDEIQAEKKYKAPFHFVPSHTLVLYTNHLPKVGANDDGIWRRLIVIPFNAKIIGDNDIKNYADYLFDHAGSFIMSWIIEGAKKAYDMDFKVPLPKVVVDAIEAYREDNDWLGHFLADCCDIDKAASEKSGELYQAYRAYCMQNGEFTRSTTDFYSSIEKSGFPKKKVKTGSFVYGLKLKQGQDFLE